MLRKVQSMFSESVVHGDWSPPGLGRAETRPPASARPRRRGSDRVLQPKVPDSGGAGPRDDGGRDLGYHVLQCHHYYDWSCDQWGRICYHYPVPCGSSRWSRVHNDGTNLFYEMPIIQTIQADDIGLKRYFRRRFVVRNTYAALVSINPIYLLSFLRVTIRRLGAFVSFEHQGGSDVLASSWRF